MAIIKCKMCGGDLEISPEMTVAECEYCGTKQTVPTVDNEKKITLFSRANRLRFACEFDKAAGVYESIVAEFPEEAEAYWGLVLCKYGIEYVDDPATAKKIPTCHRSSFDSVMEDGNFELVMEYSDVASRKVYREEAKAVEELRKGIIEISGKEEPYDIFICYKETDENGQRTLDSVLAQDIYDALTEKGYRVFFARITLEDKLGQAYEPYIFAALHSARIMLAVGTDYEYFSAVWVKNEWSRFLQLIASGEKKTLIPCYKNIDAYDMPKEFAKLQAQDLGKVGATQDLLRGIEKIIGGKSAPVAQTQETVVVQNVGGTNVDALLKRGNMALEDQEWDKANEFFEEVLNQNAECAEAYLGKAMAEANCGTREEYTACCVSNFDLFEEKNFQRVRQFATEEMQQYLRQLEEQKLKQEEKEKQEQTEREKQAKQRAENIPYLAETRKRLKKAEGIIFHKWGCVIGLKVDGTVVAAGSNRNGECCNVSTWRDIVAICAGYGHMVGLKSDGTVVTARYDKRRQFDVSSWHNIVAISGSGDHVVGLKSNGTVVAVGDNLRGECDVSTWRDIVAISAVPRGTIGLKSDGHAVAVGHSGIGKYQVSTWSNFVDVSGGTGDIFVLRSDGKVRSAKLRGIGKMPADVDDDDLYGVSAWRDIVAICTGWNHVAGLRADGTVVASGANLEGECDVSAWRDIVAISAGLHYTVGLKSDGTVVAVGDNINGQCDVSSWRDIVAINATGTTTIGLKSDGTVVAVGGNERGQCNVTDWKLFNSLDTLEDERKEAARAARERQEAAEKAEQERQQKIQRLQSEQSALKTELANLKGLFSGKRRKEIETRLKEIDLALSKL